MATSLAAQLRKLQAPQTSLLAQDKKRPSLLFDPKDAANYDRQTIYELGVAGLEELKTLNARFSEFESTLFDVSSISFERAVQSKEVNRKLDNNVKKFFFLLSPYLLLKPAHKALEWLVQRFHVHQYNVDDFLMLALPYHESRIFIRVVQLVDVSAASNPWHWLEPMQKKGVPLSKSALMNHASTTSHFLRLLCDSTVGAVKEHGPYAGVLSTLLAFYSTTLLGMLDRGKHGATELQMVTIIDALQRGLGSSVLDFAAASYIILGRLVASTSLSNHILEQLMNRITKVHHAEIQSEKAMLLILIYQSQKQNVQEVPFRTLSRLASVKDTAAIFGVLASKGYDVVPFLVPLMRGAIDTIMTKVVGSTSDMRSLIENILQEVHFNESGAEQVVRLFIESFDISTFEEVSEVPLVAIGEINTIEEVTEWYTKILKQLERSYPTVFDKAVSRALKGLGVTPSQAATMKQMLGFELQLDLFDKLHHQKSRIRAEALLSLSKQCASLKERDEQTLKDSLFNVLADDSALVVLASLSFPVEVLQRILSPSSLQERLVRILQNHVLNKNSTSKWVNVIPRVILTLTEVDEGDHLQEIETLVVLLPHMVLNEEYVEMVLASSFASRNCFIQALKTCVQDKKSIIDGLHNVVDNKPDVLPLQSILEFGEKFILENSKSPDFVESRFSLLILLGASLPKGVPAEKSLDVLQLASRLIEGQTISAGANFSDISGSFLNDCFLRCTGGNLPLEGYLHVIKKIIEQTELNISFTDGLWLDLEAQSPSTMLLVQLYCVLLEGCASESNDIQSGYVASLKLFFKVYLPSQRRQIEFLANFWPSHRVVNFTSSINKGLPVHLRVRSLRLAALLLNRKGNNWVMDLAGDNIVVPALLVALCCPAHPVRKAALDIVRVFRRNKVDGDSYNFLMDQIRSSEQEIALDSEQLQLVLYTSLSPDPIVQKMLPKHINSTAVSKILNTLLDVILSKSTPPYIASGLLHILTSVNSEAILMKLLPLLLEILSTCKGSPSLNLHFSNILCNIVNRFDSCTAAVLGTPAVWTVMDELLANRCTVVLVDQNKNSCPAEIACNQVTRELWEALPKPQAQIQQRLLSLLLSAGTEAENPLVLSGVAKCVKQLSIDASLVVAELNKMKDATVTQANTTQVKRRSMVAAPSPQILEMKEWRCGITLLELLQNKKKLNNVQILLPVLFDILKKCLYFEEQAPVEYTKQLILSCILHCCQKLSPDGKPIPESVMRSQILDVDAVVHCVRGTQNPQTHHHALLLLAHMAALVPEQVLLNIMAIFTFMGSLVLRQDDAYSFQIITKIVDTIIPILIKASNSGALSHDVAFHLDATIASVMRVFVDALLDIPEHRRLSLFHKLLTTLNPHQYLWLFLCLVMESHTLNHSETTNESRKTRGSGADGEAPKRIEVALQIVTKFTPDTILLNCVRLLQYLLALPIEKDVNRKPLYKKSPVVENLEKFKVKSLFDVSHHTPKHLRHYKYTIVTFLSALLSSLPFVNQITSMDEDGTNVVVPVYMELLEVLMALIQVFSRQTDLSVGTPTAKYWRVMLAQAYDILDKVNALLPSRLFLNIVSGLMTNDLQSLRRKAMELLNSRLSSSQREAFLTSCDTKDILAMLDPLVNVVVSIESLQTEELNEEIFLNQQTALLSIKYLAKYLAYDNYTKFKPILEHMTSLISKGQVKNANLLASVVLCAAELCSSLRAHAISSLPVLMPAFIKLLASQITQVPDVVQVSLAASMYRIVESLAAFISPYLHPLLVELCGLSASHFVDEEDQGRAAHVASKLKSTRQKIGTSIPTRVLVPAVENAYKDLVSRKQLHGIGPLMNVLAESFGGLVSTDLVALQGALTDFFLNALQLRSSGVALSPDLLDDVESHVIKALVAFVLKLSETSFRPLYYKFFDWATRLMEEHKERTITFYKLSHGIAECLKGLFVSFAGHFLKNAASLLGQCNLTKIGDEDTDDMVPGESNGLRYEKLFFGNGPIAEANCCLLVTNILKTLHCVFLYDSQNFLSKERFETLMQPIVDQLENTLGGEDGLRQRATEVLVPCIVQMAVACTDDTLWKQLNYQILIKTRNSNPMVRLVSLEAVCGVARKLGEGFLPLLPETVPFLAELLEDEEESIETACRRAVQDLEQVLGEPLQKYF